VIPLYQVDAFADRPFSGNPAAVCLLNEPADEAWMQAVAAEMNLSETAFLALRANGGFDLRWFTPAIEVDLCGHATLASAHILWQTRRLGAEEAARFHTRSGLLTAKRAGAWIQLDFPTRPAREAAAPLGLLPALDLPDAVFVGRSIDDWLVVTGREAAIRALKPDQTRLATVPCRGVIVTAPADAGQPYDVVSRFFAPAAGIAEDPVTGSAHCTLAPFWSARLNRHELTCFQASRRGGIVRTSLSADRVLLSGQAVTVFEGQLQA
jgi:predicted PhzF superfamily epimerase YddE/YHI9